MTGSAADKPSPQPHIYSKQQKKHLEKRFKDPNGPLKLVIVRDMWLTGFDAPCAHTMYVGKPMKSHNLMQAIARVNPANLAQEAFAVLLEKIDIVRGMFAGFDCSAFEIQAHRLLVPAACRLPPTTS